MRRRGFSLVELMLVMALTAMIVGTLASLYGFSMNRAARSASRYAALEQANNLADKIEATVQQAVSCSIVTSGSNTGLKCVMPSQGQDRDGDGYVDRYSPTGVTRRGLEKFGTGKRVWFYDSDSAGAFTSSGTILRRAERVDDSLPTSSDVDRSFTYYSNTSNYRYNLVSTASMSVNASSQIVTIVITASSQIRGDRVATAADADASETVTVTKSMYWRNWRK